VIANDPKLHEIWLEAIQHVHASYVKLADKLTAKLRDLAWVNAGGKERFLDFVKQMPQEEKTNIRKAARQAARSVLPNATETKIFVTANARALRHFLEQRGSASAEPEIRKLAGIVLDVLQKDSPNLFGDYTRTALPDGTDEINTPYRKV